MVMNGPFVENKEPFNLVGVIFEDNLSWHKHVAASGNEQSKNLNTFLHLICTPSIFLNFEYCFLILFSPPRCCSEEINKTTKFFHPNYFHLHIIEQSATCLFLLIFSWVLLTPLFNSIANNSREVNKEIVVYASIDCPATETQTISILSLTSSQSFQYVEPVAC